MKTAFITCLALILLVGCESTGDPRTASTWEIMTSGEGSAIDQENQRLRGQTEANKRAMRDLGRETSELEADKQELARRQSELRVQRVAAENELARLDRLIREKEQAVGVSRNDLENAKSRKRRLEDQIKRIKEGRGDRIVDKEKQIKTLQEELEALEAYLATL